MMVVAGRANVCSLLSKRFQKRIERLVLKIPIERDDMRIGYSDNALFFSSDSDRAR